MLSQRPSPIGSSPGFVSSFGSSGFFAAPSPLRSCPSSAAFLLSSYLHKTSAIKTFRTFKVSPLFKLFSKQKKNVLHKTIHSKKLDNQKKTEFLMVIQSV